MLVLILPLARKSESADVDSDPDLMLFMKGSFSTRSYKKTIYFQHDVRSDILYILSKCDTLFLVCHFSIYFGEKVLLQSARFQYD